MACEACRLEAAADETEAIAKRIAQIFDAQSQGYSVGDELHKWREHLIREALFMRDEAKRARKAGLDSDGSV